MVNRNTNVLVMLSCAAGLAGCVDSTTPVAVQAPAMAPTMAPMASSADLSSFVGARAGQGEMGVQNMGYTLSRTQGLTSYWYNASAQTCARIVTSNGRYSSVDMVPVGQC